MVDLIGTGLVADVADTHVPLEDALASCLLSRAAQPDQLLRRLVCQGPDLWSGQ